MDWNNFVWLVAGSQLQIPMLTEIKSRGFDVLVTDGNENCSCRSLADYFVQIDTYDINSNLNYAKGLKKSNIIPKAVITDSADVGTTVSSLADFFKLPGTPLDVAKVINNKVELHKALGENTVPVWLNATNMWCAEAWVEWLNKCNSQDVQNFPCVIKPVNSCGSRGIKKINNLGEFERYYYEVGRFNKFYNDSAIIIEQCLFGNEFASDWFVVDGIPIYINGAKRIFGTKFGFEAGHTNPWYPVPDVVQYLVQNLVSKTGYMYGPLKVDFIEDKTYGFCILEAATRWSGGYDHGFTAKVSTGRNLEKPLLQFALGEKVDLDLIENIDCYSAAIGFVFENPDVDKIKGVDGFVNVYVNGAKFNYQDLIVNDNSARNVFVITKGKDEDEAWKIAVNCRKIITS